jgi:hypothetical protein
MPAFLPLIFLASAIPGGFSAQLQSSIDTVKLRISTQFVSCSHGRNIIHQITKLRFKNIWRVFMMRTVLRRAGPKSKR